MTEKKKTLTFEETEVKALAVLVGMAAIYLGGVLRPEERSVIEAIYAAADIESKEGDR